MEAPHTPTPESVPLSVTLGGLQVCSYSGAQNRLVSSAELSGGKRRPEWEGAANPPSLWLWRQRKGPPAKERSGLRKLETSRRTVPALEAQQDSFRPEQQELQVIHSIRPSEAPAGRSAAAAGDQQRKPTQQGTRRPAQDPALPPWTSRACGPGPHPGCHCISPGTSPA